MLVQPPCKVDDGAHLGAIIAVEERTTPYHYLDVVIEINGIKLKAGYPAQLTPESKLGMLLRRFGSACAIGEDVDPKKILIGQKCTFITMTEQTKRGSFAKVIPESVKPSH